MSHSQEIVARHKEYLFPCVFNYYQEPLVFKKGEGFYLYNEEGEKYLDFFGGILTVSVGHCHPKVTQALTEQVKTLVHTSTVYPNKNIVDLAQVLAEITPGDLKKSFFTNSGTEADETAVLLARIHTGNEDIIALRHAYSGRSALGMTLTAHGPWKLGRTSLPNIHHAHTPYCYRCPFKATPENCGLECAKDIEELIQTTTPGKIAAFLAEPIQGVGGFITPPKEYFKVAVEIIRKYGGLFIADEVQTGFGRTGTHMFGIEHYDVQPDIITMAKGIANGSPMGVTIAREAVANSFTGLSLATFGGNPVSTAAALATIEVIRVEKLPHNAQNIGDYFRKKLEALKEKYTLIGEVRGMGLMQGLELVRNRKTKEPAKAEVNQLFEETKKRHLLIGKGGLYGNVIRLSPALNITKSEVDEAVRVLDESFAQIPVSA
jgi:alanine-glyoxylate transaminase/(R)-3-amino-2-methylpropionate-pyruvate transaminase